MSSLSAQGRGSGRGRTHAEPSNPKGTWSNPFDAGTMIRVDKDTIVFTDPAGNRAVFTKHPNYATPVIQLCD